ncbi:hypothetical protein, partial [Streptomyces sp. CoH17]|uniref:hypothetical protein n=1 Tax=Streptomyces sp. CoH17 TaxID=2992806 RepID=UPI00226E7AB7
MSSPAEPAEEKLRRKREQNKQSAARYRAREKAKNASFKQPTKSPDDQLTAADLRRREQKKQSKARASAREKGEYAPVRRLARRPDDQLTAAELRHREQKKQYATRRRARAAAEAGRVGGGGQGEGYLPEIAAVTIYADYREVFPQWPEVPP